MLFNVEHNLEPVKVVWKYIAGKITGKADLSTAVGEPLDHSLLGVKPIIADNSLIFVPLSDVREARYLSAVLNSSIVYLAVASYSVETHISTHITQNLRIPDFNPNDKAHVLLSELSRKAHELAQKYHQKNGLTPDSEPEKIEEEIDETVAQLYGITEQQLDEIKKTLRILKEGEAEESREED